MSHAARFHGALFPLSAAALALAVAACGGGALPPLRPVLPPAVVYVDDAGGVRDSVRLVVRDPAEFGALWRRVTAGQGSPPPLPAVDFGREMVLAVAAGRMQPNDRIRVDSVGVRRGPGPDGKMRGELAVLVRTTAGCRRFPTASFPVQLVRVRKYDGPVRFVERRERGEGCA
jgi:hypothetical protein